YTEGLRKYAEYFIHPDARQEYLEKTTCNYLKETLSEEQRIVAVEYRKIKDENGNDTEEASWIRANVILAESKDGKARKALYVAQDVTESKRKEEHERRILQEACDAANHANASKSEFLSRMSHDIRTPMNAIIGMTSIAGAHLDDRDRVSDCLSKITVSSKHLLSLINEVLDMSKIESGKINLTEEEFSLSELVGNILTIIRPSIEAKEHELEFQIGNLEHEEVIGDGMRLQQVLINIVGNAVKYTPQGGHLHLELSEKKSTLFGYGCYEFIVQDDGIGMTPEYLEKIFEPFSRAEDSRISKIEGTGLGMAIALNIVRKMNGDISVESKVNEGSKFTVTVYLKQQNTVLPDTKQLIDLPVLVVDDDKDACESVCTVLNDIGMKSEYVLSGKEAVFCVTKSHQEGEDFFAVILDWKMPDMDGLETARQIRKSVGDDVPIIILSAYDWSGIENEAREAGVNGFISKPLFKSRLVYLFRQIVGEEESTKSFTEEISSEQSFMGKRILIVEDNDLNREIAEEIIGSFGVEIETAENGKQAVEQFKERGEGYYDLIFMDVQMPVMNGYEASKEIRAFDRADAAVIPIIAMTANAFAEDVVESKKAGMSEHITKPLDIGQLKKCLNEWLGKK
ncbi:MAG: response regulator, partial [Lachnospiraceae bacterium]|nr:response regulator [Lachnospiraceae bacterium]